MRKLSTDEFIEKAKSIHGNKYDYSRVSYVNNKIKVVIICPVHGEFYQKPNHHLNGQGCPSCKSDKIGELSKSNLYEFIKKSKEVHGDKYDYSKVKYIGNKEITIITCPVHGDFEQKPNNHLNGQGCPSCKSDKIGELSRYTKEEFIEKAKEIHGDKYDYSKVEYKGSKEKVTITCLEHGDFKQSPSKHLNGQGCPECGKELIGFWNPEYIRKHHPETLSRLCTLYIVKCYDDNEVFIKVGITTNNVHNRYYHEHFLNNYNYELLYEYQSTLLECSELEQDLLRLFKNKRYTPNRLFGGHTECLYYESLSPLLDILENNQESP